YTVTVSQTGGGPSAMASVTVHVIDPQIQPLPGAICQSAQAFDLVATPPGGYFVGAGILDSLLGTLDPDTAGPGLHSIEYILPDGCSATLMVAVDSMDAGPEQAACPGTPPFFVQGSSPQGGTWSGPFVQGNGLFDPVAAGSYVVTYSAGACTDSVSINVADIVAPLMLDTLCQSEVPDTILVSPFGGLWYGPGIVDSIYGVFDPDEAEGGTHILTYALQGCSSQIEVTVRPVDIGGNTNSCPSEDPYLLSPAGTPAGGAWNGLGIVDPLTGLYDPFLAGGGGNVTDVLTYAAPNGCVDTIVMYVRWTSVDDDTLFFCADEDPLILDQHTTGRTPWGGDWFGTGVFLNPDDHFFDPSLAGPGVHVVTYLANTCSDSLVAVIHPAAFTNVPTTVCVQDPPFVIMDLPPGAEVSGPGIDEGSIGIFDPAGAGAGTHTIMYTSIAGCTDTLVIDVIPFEQATISGVDMEYCSNAVQVDVELEPPGGTFQGLPSTSFDPSQLNDGTYTLIYTVGSGACSSSDTLVFVDHPALSTELLVSQDPICDGGGSTLEVVTSGGAPGAVVTYQWSNGLFPVASHTVSPSISTTFFVQTSDGCSDAVTDSVTIDVFPPFLPEFAISPQACYGEPGIISASVPQPGSYAFEWNSSPPQSGPVYSGEAGDNVFLTVTEIQSGCAFDTLLQLTSWPPITALFSVNPDVDCVPYDQSEVTFIDLSNNADSGYWMINGNMVPYVAGSYPEYDLGAAGTYSVSLVVFNEGGCSDSLSLDVCILDATPVFIPDIFSPNGDGANDVFFVRGRSIESLDLIIYDRYGGELFRTNSVDHGWDGRARGQDAASGVYVYMGLARLLDGTVMELRGDVTLVR
ncbi:MAG: gliding motility-associated C-terminal domain-containing protein, partial [Flavobacteriales bacterium]|nr:gliding motility-associated C-terminal domain-containing protein [Flavobacteriales bacterium]